MPIVKLESARNLSELAQRLFGLTAQDTRLATAVKALAAANPSLPADLSTLPPATPIVVPAVSGLMPAPGAASAAPQDINVLNLVRYVADASKKIVAAVGSALPPAQDPARTALLQRLAAMQTALKVTPTAPQQVDPKKLQAQLQVLTDNVERFLKLHGG